MDDEIIDNLKDKMEEAVLKKIIESLRSETGATSAEV